MKTLSDRILLSGMRGRRLAAFVAAAFAGLFIIMGAVMLLIDIRSIWAQEDSFLNTDYIVVNRHARPGVPPEAFSEAEIADLETQPWVRRVGPFSSADFRVAATIDLAGRDFSSLLFFESVPDDFLDIPASSWHYTPDGGEVPVILSKSYLTLYNFGFARSAGMPQINEQLLSSIPLTLDMTSNDGTRTIRRPARVVALSNRLNTILVPEAFLKEANANLGGGNPAGPGRLIIDVSRPGDTAIGRYLSDHGLESAAGDDNSAATFLLRVAAGVAGGVGGIITLLGGVILTLSISLLFERNRERIARLRMLGYPTSVIARPFRVMILRAVATAWVAASLALFLLTFTYRRPLAELGGEAVGFLPGAAVGLGVALLIYLAGRLTVRKELKP